MAPKEKGGAPRAIVLSLLLSGVLLGWGVTVGDQIDPAFLGEKLLWPLVRLLVFIAFGLAAGELIEAWGWTRHLGVLSRPLFRFARLGDHCGAVFTTAFFSGTAANTMLASYYQDGKIRKKELILTNLLNHIPAYFLHLPTTLLIVLPLTGRAGVLYFIMTFSALVLRCSVFLLYGRFFSTASLPRALFSAEPAEKSTKQAEKPILMRLRTKLPGRLMGIAVYVVPIYIAVFVLHALSFFDLARTWLAGFVTHSFVPVESLSVVVVSFASEFTSGFAAAGALLDAGVLTVKQTALALLMGNILAFPMRALRHQLPRYMGIFSPTLGLELLLLGQGFRVVSLIVAGGILCIL